jgi:hypothetical protein
MQLSPHGCPLEQCLQHEGTAVGFTVGLAVGIQLASIAPEEVIMQRHVRLKVLSLHLHTVFLVGLLNAIIFLAACWLILFEEAKESSSFSDFESSFFVGSTLILRKCC